MQKQYYIYILTNFKRNVLYIGVTGDLIKRIWEHKQNMIEGFTKRYKVHYLVHYEIFEKPEAAIAREKQIKSWSRGKKDKLIQATNANLDDLYQNIV